MRDKLGATIRHNVRWNTMLGKHIDNKKFGQLSGSDSVICGDENALLGEAIYYYQDSSKCKGDCGAELNRVLAGGPKLIYYYKRVYKM